MAKKFDNTTIKKGSVQNLLEEQSLNGQKDTKRKKSDEKQTGRPKKLKDELLSKKLTLNFTKAEYEKLEALSEKNMGAPLTKLIRRVLQENNII